MNESAVVDVTIASETVYSWLKSKRIPQTKIDKQKPMVENLIESVSNGSLVLREDGKWEQILIWPIKDEHGADALTKIVYRDRITDLDVKKFATALKPADFPDAFELSINKTLLALTGQPVNYVLGLDRSTDKPVAEAIAFFFM